MGPRQLIGRQPAFRPQRPRSNFYRVILLLSLILAALWLLLGYQRGQVKSPFDPTPTPTRLALSYFEQAQAYFDSGVLDKPDSSGVTQINDAIDAYRAALVQDPTNSRAWAELARIQVYSSSLLRNDTERLERLEQAVASATEAVRLEPEESYPHAIRAFALDWLAFNALTPPERTQELLIEAEQEASRAFQLENENPLALAFYAEILADQQKWLQAERFAAQAVEAGPELMDTHRVYGYVLETLAQYNSAIQQYLEAVRITPNLTFLYIRIGVNYREGIRNPELALDYFDRAARINESLGVQNPAPYIEIARTYTQQGQFFAASINAEKALSLDNTNANVYGQLGIIFRRARNYEGANPLLQCAVLGCTAAENEMGGVAVQGLPLTSKTVAYYYVEYGTNLAFLSRPTENYCPRALPILQQVKTVYPEDVTLVAIAEDSEGICRRVQAEAAGPATATPQVVPTPEELMPR